MSTPPPPPRPLTIPRRPLAEGEAPRQLPRVPRPGPSIETRINRAFAMGLLMGALIIGSVAVAFLAVTDAVDARDPWHGVPTCTAEIADAGGICHGEPQ